MHFFLLFCSVLVPGNPWQSNLLNIIYLLLMCNTTVYPPVLWKHQSAGNFWNFGEMQHLQTIFWSFLCICKNFIINIDIHVVFADLLGNPFRNFHKKAEVGFPVPCSENLFLSLWHSIQFGKRHKMCWQTFKNILAFLSWVFARLVSAY